MTVRRALRVSVPTSRTRWKLAHDPLRAEESVNPTLVFTIVLGALLLGSLAYTVLSIEAVRRYRLVRPSALQDPPPISLLRPLCGTDEGTEENLRSCFSQDYPRFEVVVAVHRPDDPAVSAFEKVRAQFPCGPDVRLIVAGTPLLPNAKAHSLHRLVAEARNDLLVMTDSDVRLTPDTLRVLAAEFQDPAVGVITCPYRGVAGRSIWSRLEALGMNTEFLGGVLVSRMLEGMKFALGPTIAARREVIESTGGFQQLGEFLAEDFVLGQRAAQAGYRVLLSAHVVEHRIGSQPFLRNFRHRLRWARSTRRSRPAGYWGQVFTNPLPLALLLWIADRHLWPLVILTMALRGVAAWQLSNRVLSQPVSLKNWFLVAVQDLLTLFVWAIAFFGDEIEWGGRTFKLRSDGRFELAPERANAFGTQSNGSGSQIFAPQLAVVSEAADE